MRPAAGEVLVRAVDVARDRVGLRSALPAPLVAVPLVPVPLVPVPLVPVPLVPVPLVDLVPLGDGDGRVRQYVVTACGPPAAWISTTKRG